MRFIQKTLAALFLVLVFAPGVPWKVSAQSNSPIVSSREAILGIQAVNNLEVQVAGDKEGRKDKKCEKPKHQDKKKCQKTKSK